jgi:hypothetical protein
VTGPLLSSYFESVWATPLVLPECLLLDLLREALRLEELRLCINFKYKRTVSQIKSVNCYLFRVSWSDYSEFLEFRHTQ